MSALAARHGDWMQIFTGRMFWPLDPRPVKPFLAGYREAEDRVMAAVAERFGLDPVMPDAVKVADGRILEDERRQNMSEPPHAWNVGPPLGVEMRFWTPVQAKRAFLSIFRILWKDHQQREGGR